MDFAGMKRRDLQALCKRHGLPAGGTNAALAARLAVLLGVAAGAGDEAEVVARKGCLKRAAGGNDFGQMKKVSFVLEQSRRRRRRSLVNSSPAVVSKTRGQSNASAGTRPDGSADAEAGGRGRGRRRRAEAGGGSADEDSVAAEAGAGAPVRRSRRNSITLSDVEAVQEQAVAVDRKRKWKSQEKEEETAVSAQVEVPCRVTRRSSLSGAALLSPLAVDKKRGRRKAADGKKELEADDQVAEAQDLAVVGSSAVVESKRSGRKGDDEPVVQNAKVEAPGRISRSQAVAVTVMEPIVVEKKRRRTIEYEQPEVELPADLDMPRNDAPISRALRNRVLQVNNCAVERTHVDQELENKRQATKQGARRNQQQLASSMEEEGQGQVAAPSKCPPSRRSGRKNSEANIADSETNKSASIALLSPLAVDKKTGRRKAADGKKELDADDQVAEAQDLAVVGSSAVFESKRRGRKGDDEPVVQNAKVEAPGRITRSQAVAVTVMEPIVVEKKKRRTIEYEQPEVELPADLNVPRNDAPISRALRNRVLQVNNSTVEGTHVDQELENKRQAIEQGARRNQQQLASSTEEEGQGQVAVPAKCPPSRQSGRKNSEASIADSETNKSSSVPMESSNAKDENVEKQPTAKDRPVRRLTRKSVVSAVLEKVEKDPVAEKGPKPEAHATRSKRKSVVPVKNIPDVSKEFQNAKDDDVVKQPAVKEPARRSTRKSIVSAMLGQDDKDLAAEKGPEPEAHVTISRRKSVVSVKNIQDVYQDFRDAKVDDVVKQPAVKKPDRRSIRKSVVSAMLEEEDKSLIAEKSPEAYVRRSKRKSVVPVKDCKGEGEETQNAKDKDVAKQPAVTEPVRRSTRKSVVSPMVEEEGKDLIVEKCPEAHVRTLKRKSVVPVKDSKGDSDKTQNTKGEDTAKQLAVKKPVRRSTRKSVASGMLEKDETDLTAAKKQEAHDKRSVRKSVLPIDIINKENQDHIKMARNEGKGGYEEKQLKVKGPVRLSRRSVATMVFQKKGFHEETKSEIPMTRSTRKSVAPNADEKGDIDHTEMVGRKLSGVGSQNLKARAQITEHGGAMATSEIELHLEVPVQNSLYRSTCKSSNHRSSDDKTHSGMNKYISCEKASEEVLKLGKRRRSSVEISSPSNDSSNAVDVGGLKFRNQSNTRTPNKIDSKGTNREMTSSKGRATKRRTIVPEEVEEAECEDMMIMEAIRDTVTRGNESSRRMEEICQYNAAGEEFSSGRSLVTLHEECIETIHNVISGSESADAQNPEIYPSHERESSGHNKQTQEYCAIQTDDDLLSEARIEELDQSSSITEVLRHDGIVSEDKTLRDGGEVKFGNKTIQIVNASSDGVGLETSNTSFRRSTTSVLIVDAEAPMVESSTVNAATKQSDAEAAPTVLSCCDGITVMVTEPQFAGQNDGQGVSTDASESVPPISDTSKQESHSDMGKCLSESMKGSPLSPNPHSDGADADSILPALDAAKGSSSDRSHSFFGLDFLFVEERKESSSRNDTHTVAEVDYGSKPSACVSPSFCMRSDCGVECENVQTLGHNADKMLDVGHGVAQEEFMAVEKSNNEHVAVQFDRKTKSNYEAVDLDMESNCIFAENNSRPAAESRDYEQAVIQVQQDAVQEGTLEKPSLCSAAPENKHECRLLEEAGLHSISNKRCSPGEEQSPLGLQSLFSQESLDDSMQHGALASATRHTESGVAQLKDCHVQCTGETTTVPQPISHHDTHLVTEIVDCTYMSQQNNVIEGLPEVSHEELVSSSLSGFSVDPNHRKEVVNSTELTCKGDRNMNIFYSEDLNVNASCEKSHVNMSVDSDFGGISGTVLSCSLLATDADNDDVRLGSNLAQSDSADLLVELIGGSNTEVRHSSQKEHHIEDKENQVASRPCPNDIMGAATAKCIESGVMLLPAEERENLKDGQHNSKLKSSQAVGSVCNCNKDISNTLDDGSVAGIIGERNSPGFILPKDYPADNYLQHQLLDDLSVEKSLERSAVSAGKNVSTAGTVENPSFDSAISEHKGILFEEVEHRMKNYVGTCPSNPKELLMELQSMSSKENIEESDQDNLALPISGFRGDESTIVEQHVEVHSGFNLSQFESNDFVDESIQYFNKEMLHQGHNNQCNGDSSEEQVASQPCTYDTNTSEAATVKYIESKVDLLPVEERSELQDGQLNSVLESAKVVESSLNCSKDVRDILENGSADIVYEKFLFGDQSDSRVNTMNNFVGTCLSNPRELLMELQTSSGKTIEDLNPHDNLAFPKIEREADESTICHVENLADTVVSSEPGVYLSPSQHFSRDKGKKGCMSGSVKNSTINLPEDCHLARQKQDVPDVLSLSQCPKESIDCQDEGVLGPGTCYSSRTKCTNKSSNLQWTSRIVALNQDQRNENSEHKITSGFTASGMSEAATMGRSGRVTDVVSAAGTSELPDEQINTKLEGPQIEEHSVIHKDTSSLFDAELVGKSKASNLPQDTQLDPSSEHNLPNVAQLNPLSAHNFPTDLSAPRSPEKSTMFQNDNVSGSVGTCPSSRRRAMDEISTKLQKFKVSSAVKGRFISMSASRLKQGDSLSQSAATALLRNIENMRAVKVDHPVKPNPHRSAAEGSPRLALQPLGGRPRDR